MSPPRRSDCVAPFQVSISWLVELQRAKQLLQRVGSYGLDHVMIETSPAGAKAIFLPSISGKGDQDRVGSRRSVTQAARDFVAVHPGQPDIKNDDLGSIRRGDLDRARTVVCAEHLMTPNLQKHRHAFGSVPVVVHDQETVGCA